MSIKPRSGPYREITPAALLLGLVSGVVLAACFTYAGLLIGFTIGGSAVAAILGFGILRGVLGKGTIVENNINQTVASAINTTHSGLIFTIPAFYLMNREFDSRLVTVAAIAGALLGIFFIIPIRKQMIDLDRLRFPTGTAVATVLRSPGAGVAKSRLLLAGIAVSAVVYFLSQFPVRLGEGLGGGHLFWIDFELLPHHIDLGRILGLPGSVDCVWALSLFALGAGFITGRPGLVVLAGGILAYWLITPAAVAQGWLPAELLQEYDQLAATPEARDVGARISRWAHDHINQPIGIGMLIGGALAGIAVVAPSIKAALGSLRRADLRGGRAEELPLPFLYLGVAVSFVMLFVAAWLSSPIGFGRALLVAVVGTLWLGLAGIIVAQATGMTDWSPISGLTLIAVVLILALTGNAIGAAILLGAAVCVAVGECADMMQDFKTGYLVGARPIRQQVVQMAFVAIGPVVVLGVIALLWRTRGFGPGHDLAAPQAQALQAAVEGIVGGEVPWAKYLGGAVIGGVLGLAGVAGLGVLVGISMYLPLLYILPYGLGCLVNMALSRFRGTHWVEDRGVPFAAGLIVGEPLVVLLQSVLLITNVIQAPGAEAIMQRLAFLLIVLGTVGAALGVARTDPAVDDWVKSFQVHVPLTLASLAVLAAGIVVGRRARSGAGQVEERGARLRSAREALLAAHDQTDRLAAEAERLDLDRLHEMLDAIQSGPLTDFTGNRNAIAEAHGVAAHAAVLGPFAQAERYLNRAWSASADGYKDEAVHYVRLAQPPLAEAYTLLEQHLAGRAGSSSS